MNIQDFTFFYSIGALILLFVFFYLLYRIAYLLGKIRKYLFMLVEMNKMDLENNGKKVDLYDLYKRSEY